jgi:hypothetical protein
MPLLQGSQENEEAHLMRGGLLAKEWKEIEIYYL